MIVFLTVAVVAEAIAVVILWVAVRRVIKMTIALAGLAGKTLGVTDALGGLMQQTIVAATWPKKTDDERKTMN